MLELRRRRLLGGLLAGAATAALAPAWRAQGAAGSIDLESARAEGTVTLYTSLDTKIVNSIIASFTAKYGIKVEYFRGGSADVTSKVLAEADAGRLQADIVDASDVAALMLMKERGILKPYRSPGDRDRAGRPARSRRLLGRRPADPGGHPVQRRRRSARTRPRPGRT